MGYAMCCCPNIESLNMAFTGAILSSKAIFFHLTIARKKRGATERQTNERYSSVRRRCRNLRACGAQARSDDVEVSSLNSNKQTSLKSDLSTQTSEIPFGNGKLILKTLIKIRLSYE